MKKMKNSVLRNALVLLHVVSGIYAGACLSIAIVDLKYIKSIDDPIMLQSVFSPLLQNMGVLIVPQLVIMLVLCLVFSYKAIKVKSPLSSHTPLMVYLCILAVTVVVHIPINTQVFAGSLSASELMDATIRWDTWHWIRTIMSIALPVAIIKYYRTLALH